MRFLHPTLASIFLFATAAVASEPMASVKPGLRLAATSAPFADIGLTADE